LDSLLPHRQIVNFISQQPDIERESREWQSRNVTTIGITGTGELEKM
jgi:hypothetical protein